MGGQKIFFGEIFFFGRRPRGKKNIFWKKFRKNIFRIFGAETPISTPLYPIPPLTLQNGPFLREKHFHQISPAIGAIEGVKKGDFPPPTYPPLLVFRGPDQKKIFSTDTCRVKKNIFRRFLLQKILPDLNLAFPHHRCDF
jgi:hypothetical protein